MNTETSTNRRTTLIRPVLGLLLVASCSPPQDRPPAVAAQSPHKGGSRELSQNTSTGEGDLAFYDPRYCETLACYLKAQGQESVARSLVDLWTIEPPSEEDSWRRRYASVGIAVHFLWEVPDDYVPLPDRLEVERVVNHLLVHEPRKPHSFAPASLADAVKVWIHFYNGNRCHACLLSFDGGPMAQRGVDVYLIKYLGAWLVVGKSEWIS